MTAIAWAITPSRQRFGGSSVGVSEAAARIANAAQVRLSSLMRTAAGSGLVARTKAELADAWQEAITLASSGEVSNPTASTLKEAHEFIESLPTWTPKPVALIEPSGAIAFEWDFGAHCFAIFALKGSGVLEFSIGLGVGDRRWGTLNFAGSIDDEALGYLKRLCTPQRYGR